MPNLWIESSAEDIRFRHKVCSLIGVLGNRLGRECRVDVLANRLKISRWKLGAWSRLPKKWKKKWKKKIERIGMQDSTDSTDSKDSCQSNTDGSDEQEFKLLLLLMHWQDREGIDSSRSRRLDVQNRFVFLEECQP